MHNDPNYTYELRLKPKEKIRKFILKHQKAFLVGIASVESLCLIVSVLITNVNGIISSVVFLPLSLITFKIEIKSEDMLYGFRGKIIPFEITLYCICFNIAFFISGLL